MSRFGTTRKKSPARELLEFAVILGLAFALVFGVIKPFVLDAYWIPSGSMEPTLQIHDRVLANKLAYKPERGDIVVFKSVENGDDEVLIKRIVGLPGDKIKVRDGTLFVNGKPQQEPYIANNPCEPSRQRTCYFGPVTVPEGHYFMMGDNRSNSMDSRYFGAVPEENIVGEAFLRFWPPDRIGLL